MATEIEVKAKVHNTSELVEKLSFKGFVLSEPISQDDTVFVERMGDMETFLANNVFLRIRIQNDGKVILTAKKPKTKSADNLIKREHEIAVSSADEAREILALMGYQEGPRVKKIRRTAHHGKYEICLDEIEGLGTFIEVEAMGDEANAEAIQTELWNFLTDLGVQQSDQVTKGYDILILEKTAR